MDAKDEKGDFKHGAIKEFANSIGYKSGNIVSMWFNGDSTSYNGKLHEIAAKYNVSVEWLKGETEQKEKSPAPEGAELIPGYSDLTEENKAKVRDYIALLAMSEQKD